jgi:hypothetical protein
MNGIIIIPFIFVLFGFVAVSLYRFYDKN